MLPAVDILTYEAAEALALRVYHWQKLKLESQTPVLHKQCTGQLVRPLHWHNTTDFALKLPGSRHEGDVVPLTMPAASRAPSCCLLQAVTPQA